MTISKRAFTLIELLIVVAIIAILAAIAVPNFLEAQVRSKVSRVRADMRSIATAIEAYAVDANRHPWVSRVPGWALPAGPDSAAGIYAAGLTTPIAYITSIPKDPFGDRVMADDFYGSFNVTGDYWYGTRDFYVLNGWFWFVHMSAGSSAEAKWVLESKGPDLRWARDPANGGIGVLEVDSPAEYQYDPTNGTVSLGNIFRAGP